LRRLRDDFGLVPVEYPTTPGEYDLRPVAAYGDIDQRTITVTY